MIIPVLNTKEDSRIANLNERIDNYNQLAKEENLTFDDRVLLIQLLEEIDFLGDFLKKRQVQAALDFNNPSSEESMLKPMRRWEGITQELATLAPPASKGLAMEMALLNLTKSKQGLPTLREFSKGFTDKKYLRTQHSDLIEALKPFIENLNHAKQQMDGTKNSKIEYFYKLKQFKADLLYLTTMDLTEPKDRGKIQKLLRHINKEISDVINETPTLHARYMKHVSYSSDEFALQLAEANSIDIEKLKIDLSAENAINPGPPTRAQLIEKYPGLQNFKITRIGGVNNINWKLTNEETGQRLILRIEAPHPYPILLNQLTNADANEYFFSDFARFPPTNESEFTLAIGEFAEGGDLYNERQYKLAQASDNVLTAMACSRIGQITALCQSVLVKNGVHVDLKLTNFLVNAAGKVMSSDKKGIVEIRKDGSINKNKAILWTTPTYAPPEFNEIDINMNPEAFNAYQIGLTLYDYLILPEVVNDKNLIWSAQNPLDFDKPYFKTEVGQKMQELIAWMTHPVPDQRPKLSQIQRELNAISLSLAAKQSSHYEQKQEPDNILIAEENKFSRFKQSYGSVIEQRILSDFEEELSNSSSDEEMQEKIDEFKSGSFYNTVSPSAVDDIIEQVTNNMENKYSA